MSAPTVGDYLRLRRDAGLSPKTEQQAQPALSGSWALCHAVDANSGESVGMG